MRMGLCLSASVSEGEGGCGCIAVVDVRRWEGDINTGETRARERGRDVPGTGAAFFAFFPADMEKAEKEVEREIFAIVPSLILRTALRFGVYVVVVVFVVLPAVLVLVVSRVVRARIMPDVEVAEEGVEEWIWPLVVLLWLLLLLDFPLSR